MSDLSEQLRQLLTELPEAHANMTVEELQDRLHALDQTNRPDQASEGVMRTRLQLAVDGGLANESQAVRAQFVDDVMRAVKANIPAPKLVNAYRLVNELEEAARYHVDTQGKYRWSIMYESNGITIECYPWNVGDDEGLPGRNSFSSLLAELEE